MVTPFDESGNLDTESLRRLVQFLRDHVHGLFVTGFYGSGPLMSVEERTRVTDLSVKAAEGRIPVIAMIGAPSTRESVALAKAAEECGAAAVAAVGPFYFEHDEDRLLRFYSELVRSVAVPVYLYNNPKFQGYDIALQTILRLKHEGLAGVKDATFDINEHARYQRLLADTTFDVALGTESMWLAACALGCEAFIPGLGNAFPEICVKMFEQGIAGDYASCRETQLQVHELRDVMYLACSTQLAVYAMLELRGVIRSYPRSPFAPATEAEKESIRLALSGLGVLTV